MLTLTWQDWDEMKGSGHSLVQLKVLALGTSHHPFSLERYGYIKDKDTSFTSTLIFSALELLIDIYLIFFLFLITP